MPLVSVGPGTGRLPRPPSPTASRLQRQSQHSAQAVRPPPGTLQRAATGGPGGHGRVHARARWPREGTRDGHVATDSTFTGPHWIVNGSSFTLISILSLSPWKQAAFGQVLGSAGSGSVPSESTHLLKTKSTLRMRLSVCLRMCL